MVCGNGIIISGDSTSPERGKFEMTERTRSTKAPKISTGKKLEVYDQHEVAELSGYSLNQVQNHRRAGDFPNCYKMGNRWQISRRDFAGKYKFDPEGQWSDAEMNEIRKEFDVMVKARKAAKQES